MRKYGTTIVVGLVALLLLVGVQVTGTHEAHAKGPIILRLVQPAPAGDFPLTYKDLELAKRFNARANDEYKIEVMPGGGIVKVPETIDAVRVGAAEMACIDWGIFSFLDRRFGALGIAFLVDSEEALVAMCKPMLPLFGGVLQEKFNQKALGLYSVGLVGIYSNKPVKSLDDMKGLLVGSGSPPTSDMLKALGASPVYINWTDLFESLQKHVIDATMQTGHGAVAMNIIDACKYATPFYGHPGTGGYTINMDVWNKMPKHIQQILQEEVNTAVDWMEKTEIKLAYVDDPKATKAKGLKIFVLSKAERDKWKAKAMPLQEKEIADLGDFGKKIKEIADEANKRFPYDPDKMKVME